MNDWVFSFSVAILIVTFFFFGELLRELEIENKSIKDGIKNLTYRWDYRIFLIVIYSITVAIITLTIHTL